MLGLAIAATVALAGVAIFLPAYTVPLAALAAAGVAAPYVVRRLKERAEHSREKRTKVPW